MAEVNYQPYRIQNTENDTMRFVEKMRFAYNIAFDRPPQDAAEIIRFISDSKFRDDVFVRLLNKEATDVCVDVAKYFDTIFYSGNPTKEEMSLLLRNVFNIIYQKKENIAANNVLPANLDSAEAMQKLLFQQQQQLQLLQQQIQQKNQSPTPQRPPIQQQQQQQQQRPPSGSPNQRPPQQANQSPNPQRPPIQQQQQQQQNTSSGQLNESWIINHSDIRMGELLGGGGCGEVFKANYLSTVVAVKKLHGSLSEKALQEFNQEAKIACSLHFPHVVHMYGVTQKTPFLMVMEFMEKGSTFHVLRKEKLNFSTIHKIALGSARGLNFLHKKNIIHRDIKSLNILLNSNYDAKLADFGLSVVKLNSVSVTSKADGTLGTMHWKAPELFKLGGKHSYLSDIYSLGIFFWELLTGRVPYEDAEDDMQIRVHVSGGGREPIPSGTPQWYGDLITACWHQNPSSRPPIERIIEILETNSSSESSVDIIANNNNNTPVNNNNFNNNNNNNVNSGGFINNNNNNNNANNNANNNLNVNSGKMFGAPDINNFASNNNNNNRMNNNFNSGRVLSNSRKPSVLSSHRNSPSN